MALTFKRRGSETVTILRRPAETFPTMGDKPDAVPYLTVEGCSIWPNTVTEKVSSQTGVEKVDGQFTVLAGLTIFMPPGTDILPTDLVEARGVTWNVNGKPSIWDSPSTGHKAGVEVQLKGGTG